jgi:hypothetical protein
MPQPDANLRPGEVLPPWARKKKKAESSSGADQRLLPGEVAPPWASAPTSQPAVETGPGSRPFTDRDIDRSATLAPPSDYDGVPDSVISLPPEEETQFQGWYSDVSRRTGLSPNPDDREHYYDYRRAWQDGVPVPSEGSHWPSRYKLRGHPRLFVNGINTVTGRRASWALPLQVPQPPSDIPQNVEMGNIAILDTPTAQPTRLSPQDYGFVSRVAPEQVRGFYQSQEADPYYPGGTRERNSELIAEEAIQPVWNMTVGVPAGIANWATEKAGGTPPEFMQMAEEGYSRHLAETPPLTPEEAHYRGLASGGGHLASFLVPSGPKFVAGLGSRAGMAGARALGAGASGQRLMSMGGGIAGFVGGMESPEILRGNVNPLSPLTAPAMLPFDILRSVGETQFTSGGDGGATSEAEDARRIYDAYQRIAPNVAMALAGPVVGLRKARLADAMRQRGGPESPMPGVETGRVVEPNTPGAPVESGRYANQPSNPPQMGVFGVKTREQPRDAAQGTPQTEISPQTTPTDVVAEKSAVDRAAKNLGVKVRYEKMGEAETGRYNPDNPREIVLNESNPAGALKAVFSHEFVHAVERVAPDLYRTLETKIREWAQNALSRSGESYADVARKRGIDLSKENLGRESLASLVEDVAGDMRFWSEMAKTPGMFRRAYGFVKQVINRMIGRDPNLRAQMRFVDDAVSAAIGADARYTDIANSIKAEMKANAATLGVDKQKGGKPYSGGAKSAQGPIPGIDTKLERPRKIAESVNASDSGYNLTPPNNVKKSGDLLALKREKQPWEMTRREFEGAALSGDVAAKEIAKNRAGDARSKNKGIASPERKPPPMVRVNVPLGAIRKQTIQYMRDSTNADRVNRYADQKIDTPITLRVNQKGNIVVDDGGHRLLAAIKRGDSSIPAMLDTGAHKAMVKYAVEAGKPVPPEVLKDYPDLAKPQLSLRRENPVEAAKKQDAAMRKAVVEPVPTKGGELVPAESAVTDLVKDKVRTQRAETAVRNKVANDWERKLSEREREDIGAAVEGIGNLRTGKSAEEIKRSLTIKQREVMNEYRVEQEKARQEVNKYLRDNTDVNEYISFIENYIPHFYVRTEGKKVVSGKVSKWAQESPNAKQRKLPTLAEARELGLEPITQDIARLHKMWADLNWRVATNRAFLEKLPEARTEDGNPVIVGAKNAPAGYVPAPDNFAIRRKFGEGAKIHPDIAPHMRVLFENPMSHKFWRAAEGFNAAAKKMMLSLSFFHHIALTESSQAVLARPWNPIRGVMLAFEKNPATGKRMLVNQPHRVGKDLINNPEFVRDAVGHGLQLGFPSDINYSRIQRALNWAEAKTRKIPGLSAATRGLRKVNQAWDKALWDNYHNGLKAFAYYDTVEKLSRKLPPDRDMGKVKEKVAEFINDAFGGQEWELKGSHRKKYFRFWAHPKMMQAVQMGALAPDWTYSNISVAKKAVTRVKDPIARKMYGRYWGRMIPTLAATTAGLQYALYKSFGDDSKGDSPWFWDNEMGHRLDIDITPLMRKVMGEDYDNRRYYIHPGKQARENLNWLTDPFKTALYKSSPVVHAAFEQMTGTSGDFDLPFREMAAWESIPSRAKHEASRFLPLAWRANNFAFTLPRSKGMSPYKARGIMMDAIDAYANPSWLEKGLHGRADFERKFDGMVEEVRDALKANGFDPDKVQQDAVSALRGKYASRILKAAQEGEPIEDSSDDARAYVRLGGKFKSLMQSAKRKNPEVKLDSKKRRELSSEIRSIKREEVMGTR